MKKRIGVALIIIFLIFIVGCDSKDNIKDLSINLATGGSSTTSNYSDDNPRESLILCAMDEAVKDRHNRKIKEIEEAARRESREIKKSELPNILEDKFNKDEICINNSSYKISSTLLDEFYEIVNGYGADCSFYAVNVEDHMTIGYNPSQVYETASTIKAPYVLYCLKEMEKGNGSLEETKVYESRLFTYGSGIMQFEPFGGVYTLEELIYYTINYSDNIAYNMLNDRFGIEGYNDMLRELKCDEYYRNEEILWGKANAKSATLVWLEIYKFSKESKLGEKYMGLLKNALYSYIQSGVPGYETAHKSGWIDEQCHDTGIVFGEKPYTIAIMVENGGNWGSEYQIQAVTRVVNQVMEEYIQWKKDRKYEEIKYKVVSS